MSVTKDVSSAAMPYVMLAGALVVVYMFRDQIKSWFIRSTDTGKFLDDSGKVLDTSIFKPVGTTEQVEIASKIIPSWTDIVSPGGIGLIDNIKAALGVLSGRSILSEGSPGSEIAMPLSGSGGYESVSGLPGVPGSMTEQNLIANRVLFEKLPMSYEDVRKYDIIPGRGFQDFDYVKGDEAFQITSDSWHYLQYQKHSWGYEWTDVASSGGSSPAVWHNPTFVSYLEKFV